MNRSIHKARHSHSSVRYSLRSTALFAVALLSLFLIGLGCGGSGTTTSIMVTTLDDAAQSPEGETTLRKALADVPVGGMVVFDPALDGGTIDLTVVGNEHSTLKGEVWTMDMDTHQWIDGGYQDRDYGKSALYAAKDVVINASNLPNGITLNWAGAEDARVLAVLGDLTMYNVNVIGGRSTAEELEGTQPYTLARGAGLAVWGTCTLHGCEVGNNTATADITPSRDRSAFGGGIYTDTALLYDCVISGNTAYGYGAAGGGVYSIGGMFTDTNTIIQRCAVTGNHVWGQHAYGGGIYSDGGGRGDNKTLIVRSSTIACNQVSDNPDIDNVVMFQFYFRGGGMYMSNGNMSIFECTIVNNNVEGELHEFNDMPNIAGGGIGATIGDAHVVENMTIGHSIIAGNSLSKDDGEDIITDECDVYSGSLLYFNSLGYNLIGCLDFSPILVPVPEWESLSRKHWPKAGDTSGIRVGDYLNTCTPVRHSSIMSAGTDDGMNAVLYYEPLGDAIDAIPTLPYQVMYVLAEYYVMQGRTDDFLMSALDQIEDVYGGTLGYDFGDQFGDMTGTTFHGPAETWPGNPENEPWISFWQDVEEAIDGRLGPQGLGDDFWMTFSNGVVGNVYMDIDTITTDAIEMRPQDMRGETKPYNNAGDIGAIELQQTD
ncbi:MAG: hypothetical protein U5N86_11170 [Planctomycetota bacterium]|nr:hypothetical protein [Planctomycetota bacterium]